MKSVDPAAQHQAILDDLEFFRQQYGSEIAEPEPGATVGWFGRPWHEQPGETRPRSEPSKPEPPTG